MKRLEVLRPKVHLRQRLSSLRQPQVFVVLAMLILVGHGFFYSRTLGYDVVDDAYISFRYALNAAQGHGLVFNPGERRVEGYTNFLWTVLMVPVLAAGLDVRVASIVLGMVLALVGLALVGWVAPRRLGLSPWVGVLAAFLLAVDGSYALWAVGGMETPLFVVLLLLGSLAYLREQQDAKTIPVSGAWFALAAMTRPEGVLVFALTVGYQFLYRLRGLGNKPGGVVGVSPQNSLFRFRRSQAVPKPPEGEKGGIKGLLLMLAGGLLRHPDWGRVGLFAAIYVPYFLFRWRYYGYFFPNTFYAKVTLESTQAQVARGWRYLRTFVGIHLGVIPLLVAAEPVFLRKTARWAAYLALLVVGYSGYIVYVGGDWSVGRFFAPLMPWFYLLLAAGAAAVYEGVLEWLRDKAQGWRAVLSAVAVAVAVVLVLDMGWASSVEGEYALYIRPFNARLAGRARTTLGLWLRENVPPDTLIAVDAAGQLPFYSRLPTVDMFGINDLHTAHLTPEELRAMGKTMGEGIPGHEKMDLTYIVQVRRPEYIIIYGNMLDAVKEYERVDLPWTDDPELRGFLSVYRRRE